MTLEYIILGLYFLILFGIGYFASKKIHSIEDYYVGGKKLNFWIVAFSSRATGESAWLLLGLTGMGAVAGISAYWVVLGEVIGVSVAWFFMAKPFKHLTDQYNSITIPDYLVSRFNSKTNFLRATAATTLALFVVIYVSAQIDATGKAFETFLDIDYYTGAIVGFVIVVAYIFTGGFVAVAWSDVFQGALMFAGLVILPIVGLFAFEGGLFSSLSKVDPDLLDIWGSGGLTFFNVATIMGFLFIGLGFMGSPQIFVRFMSIKSEAEIKKGRWVAILFTLLADIGAVTIGLIGRILFTESGADPELALGISGENVLPMLVENLMPAIVVGIYIAIILSAIMSTIDSLLVVASSAITRDFYQQIFRPDLKNDNLSTLSRKVTLLLAFSALGIAMLVAILSPTRTIFWFVIFGWSGIAATFCPVIILSLFWKSYNENGALASMISGFLSVPIFKFLVPLLPGVGKYFVQMDVMFPSFVIAFVFGFIFTKMNGASAN
ncbi:MAG: sodium/proline symporter [Bacteroidota bacterium]